MFITHTWNWTSDNQTWNTDFCCKTFPCFVFFSPVDVLFKWINSFLLNNYNNLLKRFFSCTMYKLSYSWLLFKCLHQVRTQEEAYLTRIYCFHSKNVIRPAIGYIIIFYPFYTLIWKLYSWKLFKNSSVWPCTPFPQGDPILWGIRSHNVPTPYLSVHFLA